MDVGLCSVMNLTRYVYSHAARTIVRALGLAVVVGSGCSDRPVVDQATVADAGGEAADSSASDGSTSASDGSTSTSAASTSTSDTSTSTSGAETDDVVLPCAVEYNGAHPYLLCTEARTWFDARELCHGVGFHLLTIESAEEDAWIDAVADVYSTTIWWMGFNDLEVEGAWAWEDGSAASYLNWAPGEPNDSNESEECGQINRFHPDLGWNDEPCETDYYFICERD